MTPPSQLPTLRLKSSARRSIAILLSAMARSGSAPLKKLDETNLQNTRQSAKSLSNNLDASASFNFSELISRLEKSINIAPTSSTEEHLCKSYLNAFWSCKRAHPTHNSSCRAKCYIWWSNLNKKLNYGRFLLPLRQLRRNHASPNRPHTCF